ELGSSRTDYAGLELMYTDKAVDESNLFASPRVLVGGSTVGDAKYTQSLITMFGGTLWMFSLN
ncbi:MAG: hypothetical protein ABIK79_02180, partial [Chloroflexota bacterium]